MEQAKRDRREPVLRFFNLFLSSKVEERKDAQINGLHETQDRKGSVSGRKCLPGQWTSVDF
jgi:hypothetical protein